MNVRGLVFVMGIQEGYQSFYYNGFIVLIWSILFDIQEVLDKYLFNIKIIFLIKDVFI